MEALHAQHKQHKQYELSFCVNMMYQYHCVTKVNQVCKPWKGEKKMLLYCDTGASHDMFGDSKNTVNG